MPTILLREKEKGLFRLSGKIKKSTNSAGTFKVGSAPAPWGCAAVSSDRKCYCVYTEEALTRDPRSCSSNRSHDRWTFRVPRCERQTEQSRETDAPSRKRKKREKRKDDKEKKCGEELLDWKRRLLYVHQWDQCGSGIRGKLWRSLERLVLSANKRNHEDRARHRQNVLSGRWCLCMERGKKDREVEQGKAEALISLHVSWLSAPPGIVIVVVRLATRSLACVSLIAGRESLINDARRLMWAVQISLGCGGHHACHSFRNTSDDKKRWEWFCLTFSTTFYYFPADSDESFTT